MITEWDSAQVDDEAGDRKRDFGSSERDYISVSYDKEPEQHDLDDIFTNAPSTLKKTKRSNVLWKPIRKKARGNQWLKAKKGQRLSKENRGAIFDGNSKIKVKEFSPIPDIDDLYEGYQDAF